MFLLRRRFTIHLEGFFLRPARPVCPVRTDAFYILVVRDAVNLCWQGRLGWRPFPFEWWPGADQGPAPQDHRADARPALPRWPAPWEEIFGGERDSDQRQKPPHGPTVGWRIGSIQIHPPGTHRFINSSPIAASRGCRLSEIGCGPSVSSGRRGAVSPGLFQAGEHQKLERAITRVLWLGA